MGHKTQGIQELLVGSLIPLDVKGDHTGILAVHILFGAIMLWMTLQARIPNEADSGTAFQKFRNGHSYATVLLHTQGNGSQATGNEPRIEGAEDTAIVDHGKFFDSINHLHAAQNTTAQRITMTVNIFGHAVDLQICAVLDGIDTDRAGKCGIHAHKSAATMGNLSDSFQIADAGGGITRRFHVD